MRKDLDKLLCEKYPKLYRDRHGDPRETAMSFGFEVNSGWYRILDHMSVLITAQAEKEGFDPVAQQIKEKYGTLRVAIVGLAGDEFSAGVIRAAGLLSTRVCQSCSAMAFLRMSGWWRVHCDRCEAIHEKGGSLRGRPLVNHELLRPTDALKLLHLAIGYDIQHNGMADTQVTAIEGEEGISLRLDKSSPRVEGMIEMLKPWSGFEVINERSEK
jgi:hypothetical protein